MISLYGHPFSSYTWKAEIALHSCGIEYRLRQVDPGHPDNTAFVAEHGGPFAKFPVLEEEDGTIVFEASSIIEHLVATRPDAAHLIPADRALEIRNLDRVFDNYVMNVMNVAVLEQLRAPDAPDTARQDEVRAQLRRVYAWLEPKADALGRDPLTMADCAAAPALFYADWVEEIGPACPDLKALRERLNAMPEVRACIDAAYPFRPLFPLGAPDRD